MTAAADTPTYARDWTSHHFPDWHRWLGHLANTHCRGLEIGSFEGRSARWFAEHLLEHPQSRLICVDPYDYADELAQVPGGGTNIKNQFDFAEIRRRFEANLAPWLPSDDGHDAQVKLIVKPSWQALQMMPNWLTFDWIYIDGSHVASCVLEDSVQCWRRLNPGGVLIWDDYEFLQSTPNPDPVVVRPKFAIDAFLRIINGQWHSREQSNDQVKVVKQDRRA